MRAVQSLFASPYIRDPGADCHERSRPDIALMGQVTRHVHDSNRHDIDVVGALTPNEIGISSAVSPARDQEPGRE